MVDEKELLRITDEETGYDLVAVQNPHGDFGISTFAENEDGRKPVDGKYMLAKMIEQVGNGGGGGVLVVNFDYDEDLHHIVADHTPQEVKSALKTGFVIGRFDGTTYIAMDLYSTNFSDGIQVGACFMRVGWDSSKSAYVLTPKFGVDKTDGTSWKDFI